MMSSTLKRRRLQLTTRKGVVKPNEYDRCISANKENTKVQRSDGVICIPDSDEDDPLHQTGGGDNLVCRAPAELLQLRHKLRQLCAYQAQMTPLPPMTLPITQPLSQSRLSLGDPHPVDNSPFPSPCIQCFLTARTIYRLPVHSALHYMPGTNQDDASTTNPPATANARDVTERAKLMPKLSPRKYLDSHQFEPAKSSVANVRVNSPAGITQVLYQTGSGKNKTGTMSNVMKAHGSATTTYCDSNAMSAAFGQMDKVVTTASKHHKDKAAKSTSGCHSDSGSALPVCPICQQAFTAGESQLDIDGHIAACLSAAGDDVVW